MKILIAHRYFWPENISLFPRMLKDIAEWHRSNGDDVTILTSSTSSDSERYDWSRKNEINIHEISLKSDRGRNFLFRISTILRYTYRLIRTLIFEKYDVVITTSYPPVLSTTIVRLLKPLRGYQYVYYLQDIFPELLLEQRGLKKLLGEILKRIDRENVNQSIAVITLSAAMKQTLERRGCNQGNIFIIQNYTIEQPHAVKQKPLPERPSLIFAGNMGSLQNIKHCLLASQLAFTTVSHDFILVGDGNEQQKLKQFVKDNDLSHVQFHNKVSRDAALDLMTKANVGVVAAKPGLFEIAYPSKLLSYLFAGIPALVFTDSNDEIAAELHQFRLGVTASPADPQEAANSIVRILKDIQESRYFSELIQKNGIQLFSKDRYFSSYRDIANKFRQSLTVPNEFHERSDCV